MLGQLFFTNLHFATKVLAALVFFATGWLHIGSWSLNKKDKSYLVRGCGFFLLSLVSIFQATNIEVDTLVLSLQIIKIVGLILIFASLIKEPLLHPPKNEALAISLLLVSQSLIPLSAVLYLIIGLTYLRKSTDGFEKQVRPMFFAFLILSISEFITISLLGSETPAVFLSKVLATFGPLWTASRITELIGITILGIWSWGYLRFRAQSQLFIIFVTSSFFIFTTTTFSFTFLLLNNLENDALSHLKTDIKVLQYASERLESEALSDAKVIAENQTLINYLESDDIGNLHEVTLQFMLSQNTDFLEITNDTGKIIMRASDKEKVGDSLNENTEVISALSGKSLSTLITREGIVAPEVQIRAAAPIFIEDSVVGVVITGFKVDSAFVDGVKAVTGLDASVFADNIRSATTFISPDGKSRYIGTKETNKNVLSTVLVKGEVFTGSSLVLNQPYYTAYSPLKTEKGEVIGMLFVGKPQFELFETAEKSIQITFLGSVILMVISIIPAYFLARYIKENIKA
jgi:hypothetical protein